MAELSFGDWLKRRRNAAGLTQEQLAAQINCSTSALRKFEAELRHPSASVVERLAEIFNIPPNERPSFLRFAKGFAEMPHDPFTPHANKQLSSQTATNSLPVGTVTFLYSDMVGFRSRYEHDPDTTLELLAHQNKLLHPMMAEFDGKVFNIKADSFVVAFTDPLRAVEAAIHARSLIAKEDWGAMAPVQTKMALHVGQAKMHPSGTYVSFSIGHLEPMEKLAQGGQIILSQPMADAVRAHISKKIQLVDMGEYVISKQEPAMHLFQLIMLE